MELPWNTVAVTGVPGIGKTSLCTTVSRDLGYEYINYGDLMLSIARSQGLAFSDSEMFSLDMDVQHEIWKDAAFKIKGKERVLIDLHGVDQSQWGYIISLPVGIIKPDIIILIESSKENILLRRKKDSKKRLIDTIKSLKEHMEVLKTTMASYSAMFGSNFMILQNDDFEVCVESMKKVLGNI